MTVNKTINNEIISSDKEIEKLWLELTDIPFNENEEGQLLLDEEWLHFEKDIEREEIWQWFDEQHSKGVYYLLYEYEEITQ